MAYGKLTVDDLLNRLPCHNPAMRFIQTIKPMLAEISKESAKEKKENGQERRASWRMMPRSSWPHAVLQQLGYDWHAEPDQGWLDTHELAERTNVAVWTISQITRRFPDFIESKLRFHADQQHKLIVPVEVIDANGSAPAWTYELEERTYHVAMMDIWRTLDVEPLAKSLAFLLVYQSVKRECQFSLRELGLLLKTSKDAVHGAREQLRSVGFLTWHRRRQHRQLNRTATFCHRLIRTLEI